jgi:hypothetical protein
MTGPVLKLAAQLGSDDLVLFSLYAYCCSHCDKLFMLTCLPVSVKEVFLCILNLTRTKNVRLCHFSHGCVSFSE